MITLKDGMAEADFLKVYDEPVGSVIAIEKGSDAEACMERVADNVPVNKKFTPYPILPGTSLYTLYGPGRWVVTENGSL